MLLPGPEAQQLAIYIGWKLHGKVGGVLAGVLFVLLRHANSRITLDIYTRATSATKREANNKVMEMVIEAGKSRLSAPSQREPLRLEGSKKGAGNSQHPSAPSRV
jgi:hypothetical protein